MNKPNKSQKVLTTKQEILDYLSISNKLFVKFISHGMPALFIDGRWYAHADNIDNWFLCRTKVQNRADKLPPEALS